MDTGHYNCRDYHITPHFAPTTLTNNARIPLPRHESWDELERRSRSPASFKPKFPLLRLPLELRQEILSYLLPRTKELLDTNPLTTHARTFGAVQKRVAKGMLLPEAPGNSAAKTPPKSPAKVQSSTTIQASKTNVGSPANNVVWQKGNINIFSVCKQLHDECAELMYGSNTFLLFIEFSGITFRFRWLLANAMAPMRTYPFLELLPERYLRLIKRVVVNLDHVDSYTGMIKFNVGGKGLTHELRRQVQRLVNALKAPLALSLDAEAGAGSDEERRDERRLARVSIRVSNGNATFKAIKSVTEQQREDSIKVAKDLEVMLAPFQQLYGVREVSITGAVTDRFAQDLMQRMRSLEPPTVDSSCDADDAGMGAPAPGVCVYGNDL